MTRERAFPIGASLVLEQLEHDPHPVLAKLRASEPVSWVAALEGWLVTRHDLALEVMRDAGTFTVDDPRFSTAQVIGPSMLSLDGEEHGRHRSPFVAPFRPGPVRDRFQAPVAAEVERLLDELAPDGEAELRRAFAGPLAAAIIARALGLSGAQVDSVLPWYDAIVAAVTDITAGRGLPAEGVEAFAQLGTRSVPRSAAGSTTTTTMAHGRCCVRRPVAPTSTASSSPPTPPCCCSAGPRRPRG